MKCISSNVEGLASVLKLFIQKFNSDIMTHDDFLESFQSFKEGKISLLVFLSDVEKYSAAKIAANRLLGAVFLLWAGDSFVDLDGSTQPDKLIGVFTSLDEMNKCLDERWFEMPLDTRGKKFSADVRRYAVERKYGNSSYCYYEQRELNCA